MRVRGSVHDPYVLSLKLDVLNYPLINYIDRSLSNSNQIKKKRHNLIHKRCLIKIASIDIIN